MSLENVQLAKDMIRTFLSSASKVYCKSCGLVFYFGPTSKIISSAFGEPICDFKMLAFRHAWDHPQHRVIVKVSEHFERYARNQNQLNWLRGKQYLGKGEWDYSAEVSKLRRRLAGEGNPKAQNTSDENWRIYGGQAICSNCNQLHDSLRKACLCCRDVKPFMPFQEVDTIRDV